MVRGVVDAPGSVPVSGPVFQEGRRLPELPDSDSELFLSLITANHDQLRRYIYTFLPSEEDVKDVLQEVCIAIYRKFGEYDKSRPFLPWAYRFAYLKVLAFSKQQQIRRVIWLPTEVLELLAVTREEEETVLARRLVALEKCLEKLSDPDRRLIRARYVDRASTESIAAAFAQSRRTLFRNLERVRRLLFECIGRSVVSEGRG